MKFVKSIVVFGTAIFLLACSKEETSTITDCFADSATIRKITNAKASVKLVSGTYYLIEQGTVDSKLMPCILPAEFKEDNKMVIVTGKVKDIPNLAVMPCCIYGLVIESIK